MNILTTHYSIRKYFEWRKCLSWVEWTLYITKTNAELRDYLSRVEWTLITKNITEKSINTNTWLNIDEDAGQELSQQNRWW